LKRPKIDVVKMAQMYTHSTSEKSKGPGEKVVEEESTANTLKVEKENPKDKQKKQKKSE